MVRVLQMSLMSVRWLTVSDIVLWKPVLFAGVVSREKAIMSTDDDGMSIIADAGLMAVRPLRGIWLVRFVLLSRIRRRCRSALVMTPQAK